MRRTYSREPWQFWLGAVPAFLLAGGSFTAPAWSDLWAPAGFFIPGAIFTIYGLAVLYNCRWVTVDLHSRRVTTYRAGVLPQRVYGLDDFVKVTVTPEQVEDIGYVVRLEGSGYEVIIAIRQTSGRAKAVAASVAHFTNLPM